MTSRSPVRDGILNTDPVSERTLKKLAIFLLSFAIPVLAFAQTVPNGTITQGLTWLPSEWNAA